MANTSDTAPQETVQKKGYKINLKRDLTRVLVVASLLLLIIAVGNYFTQQRRQNKTIDIYNKHLNEIDSAKFAAAINKGEVTSIGNWQWTLVEAKDAGNTLKGGEENAAECVAGSGFRFIQTRFTVNNNEKYSGPLNDIKLFDGNKNSYSVYVPADSCLETGVLEEDIYRDSETTLKSGASKTLTAYYKVPERTGNYRLKVKEYADYPVLDFAYMYLGF